MKKRFIAGAVCPKCAEMDKLVMFQDQGVSVRECVSCGFTDHQKSEDDVQELETRVNHFPEPEPVVEPEELGIDVAPIKILH